LQHIFCCEFDFFKSTCWAAAWFSWFFLFFLIGKIIELGFHKKHFLTIILITLTIFIISNIDFIIIVIFIPKLKRFLHIFWVFKLFDYLLKIKSFFLLILFILNFNIIIIIYLKLKLIIIILIFGLISTWEHINNTSYILKNQVLIFLLFIFISWFLKFLRWLIKFC